MPKPNGPNGGNGHDVAVQHVPEDTTLPDLEALFSRGGVSEPSTFDADLFLFTRSDAAGDHPGGGLSTAAEHARDGVSLPDLSLLTDLDLFMQG